MGSSGIHIKPSHVGELRAEMHIRPGKKISVASLMQKKARDKATGNVAGEKRDVFALNAKTKWNK